MNRKLFKNKGYMYLLSAQTVSNLGDWLDILALMALVGLKWNASPLAVSGTMLCLAVPSILFGSFAGVLADRYDRKLLMILTDILRAATVVGIVFSTELWQIYILLCIKSTFSALFSPAKQGKLKEIVEDDLIQSAVATSELVNNSAKIIGPIISGMLVALIGIEWSFYLDALSFLLSAILLLGVPRTIRSIEKESHDTEKQGFFSQFTAGFTFIKQTPELLVGLLVFSLVMLVLQMSDSQFIVLIREIPGQRVDLLGWMMAGSGLGVVVASLLLNKKQVKAFLFVISLSSITLGVGYILAGAFIHLPVLAIAIIYPILGLVMGFSFGMALIPFNVMAQLKTKGEYTGRVFGTINSTGTLAVVIGMFSGGLLSELFGVINTFILAGGLLVVVGIIVYSLRKRFESEGQLHAESDGGIPREA